MNFNDEEIRNLEETIRDMVTDWFRNSLESTENEEATDHEIGIRLSSVDGDFTIHKTEHHHGPSEVFRFTRTFLQ